tara:strand:- start:3013 stop:4371 length:1359 start_codon:yes stop_codon:yes gene_type:complete
MSYDLFPHQIKGAVFLSGSTGTKGLFFGMGTGKTITALEAAKQVGNRRMLVIAPPIALPMWHAEATAYLGREAQILSTGSTAIRMFASILVVSYAIATTRAAELIDWVADGVLICDESHALKSPTAKRTSAILGWRGIASSAAYSWMLTGTPITRWNDDVFAFLCNADLAGVRERLGGITLEKFRLKHTIRQKRQFAGARFPVDMVVGNRNTELLGEWIYSSDNGRGAPLALRVDLKEVFENMPPLTVNRYNIKLEVDAELRAALKAMETMSVADIASKLASKEPALATVRRQLGVAKVKAAAAEIAERIESGESVLVGAWHTDVIDALEQILSDRGYRCVTLDGRTSATKKRNLTTAWNTGQLDVLVGQIAAMGVSLNLQEGGSQIIVVESDWSPSVMDQFFARLWRYGQEKHVHVDILTSDTKLDKAIDRIGSTKAREQAKFNEVGRSQD